MTWIPRGLACGLIEETAVSSRSRSTRTTPRCRSAWWTAALRSARRTVGCVSCNGCVACAIAAVALLGSPATARADSDGYYCVGGGFLAMEFRSFNTPGLPGPQVHKIARLDTIHGARWTD